MWKDIEGYEDLYQVSCNGEIKSLSREIIYNNGKVIHLKERILKPLKINNYLAVDLHDSNKNHKRFYIHRLVASAFIDNPDNLPEVNHKDENPFNNSVDNLEWCTHTYNLNYGTRIQKYYKAVDCIDEKGTIIKHFDSIKQALKDGFKDTSIIRACQKGYKHYGYYWKYSN